jgi:pyroglutamyl-peptidase
MKGSVILVTGFGAFPGAPHNPTAVLMRNLAAQERRLARMGIKLERRILPVVYGEIAPRLKALIAETAPDAILHFGLAGGRRAISIETRAVNHIGSSPDAAGKCAARSSILRGAAAVRRARVPVPSLNAALRRAWIASKPSNDAGDYVCNQTFYLSLAMAAETNRTVGFVHVPHMRASTLARVAMILIMALQPVLRRTSQRPLPNLHRDKPFLRCQTTRRLSSAIEVFRT